MEMSKTESNRILRSLELKAYRNVVDALRAQGTLTKNKHEVLKNLAAALKVGEERCRSEFRRAVNDDLLSLVAQSTNGKNTESTWRNESVRKVPLMPMIASQTAFTALADNISDIVAQHNSQFLETTPSLNEILEAHKKHTDENLSRYYSSKIFRPLLSNKKFREDAILAELQKLQLRNKNSQPEESVETVESSSSVPCEPQLAKTVTWNDQTLLDIVTPSSDFQSSESVPVSNPEPEVNTLRTSSNTGVVRKPVTKTTRGAKPEKHIHNNEDKASDNITVPIPKRIIVRPKRYEMDCDYKTTDVSKTTKINSVASSRSNLSENKDRSTVKRVPIINERVDEDIRDQSKPDRRRPGSAAKSRSSKVSKVRMVNPIQRLRKNDELIVTRLVDNKILRKKSESGTVVEDFTEESVSSSSKNKETDSRNSNIKKLVSENLEIASGCKSTSETLDETLNSNTPVEVSVSSASAKPTASVVNEFELNLTPAQIEEETRPHTFNLIPASRRFKLLKKRTRSPNGEIEVAAKKVADQKSMSINNIYTDVCSKEVSSSSNDAFPNSLKSTSVEENSKRKSLPLPKKRLSLLGNIKVRNLNAKPPTTSEDINDQKVSLDKNIFGVNYEEQSINPFQALIESSSESFSDDDMCGSDKGKRGGFLGFVPNGLPDNENSSNDSEFTDMSVDSEESEAEENQKRDADTTVKKSQEDSLQGNDVNRNVSVEVTSIESHPIEQLIDIASADVIIGDQDILMSDIENEPVVQKAPYNGVRVLTPTKSTKAIKVQGTVLSNVASSQRTEHAVGGFVTTVVKDQNDKKNFIIISAGKKSPRPVSEIWNSLEQRNKPLAEEKIIKSNVITSVNTRVSSDPSPILTSAGPINADIIDKICTLRQNLSKNQNSSTVTSPTSSARTISSVNKIVRIAQSQINKTAAGTLIAIPTDETKLVTARFNELSGSKMSNDIANVPPFVSGSKPMLKLKSQEKEEIVSENPRINAAKKSINEDEIRKQLGILRKIKNEGMRKTSKVRILTTRASTDSEEKNSAPQITATGTSTEDDDDDDDEKSNSSDARIPVAREASSVDEEGKNNASKERIISPKTRTSDGETKRPKVKYEDEENTKSKLSAASSQLLPLSTVTPVVSLKTKKSGLATIMQMRTNAVFSTSSSKNETTKMDANKLSLKTTPTTGLRNDVNQLSNTTNANVTIIKTETKTLVLPPVRQIPRKVYQLYDLEDKNDSDSSPPSCTTINDSKTTTVLQPVNEDSLIEISSSKRTADLEISDSVLDNQDICLINDSDE